MIKIYCTNWCGSCIAAKKMLDDMDLSYEEINIEEEGLSRNDLVKLTGGYTVPQILINDNPIGGFNELFQLNQLGKLKELLANK
tara:strand:- start:294 stop:545 length:252 start_codon:yes stop_codon:yes gene_type:complete